MASIEPYKFREKTNLQEHNDIINKVNEIVDVINDTDLDNINTRLTNDESQIAVNTTAIKANTNAIDGLIDSVDTIDETLDTIEPMVSNHETDIANLKESERRLSNDVVSTYTLYRNGEGKIKAQMETVGGTLIDSNTLDMIIPYQYDIISGTTDRSFKLNITMSDGSSYTTNDFIIPEGGGSEIVVTGITLSKDSTNVNRFHVGINLSDSTMIDSGYITMVDNVVASFVDSKLTISVNGVSSVPVAIDVSGEFTPGTGITISSGTIAIDDTVVALKSDIADMETKTNASATYATKTALALTDSVANDANEKANSAIDNVSISGSTMTFNKINDEHIDVVIPSSSINAPFICVNKQLTYYSKYSTGEGALLIAYNPSITSTVLRHYLKVVPIFSQTSASATTIKTLNKFISIPEEHYLYYSVSEQITLFSIATTDVDSWFHSELEKLLTDDGDYEVTIKGFGVTSDDSRSFFTLQYNVSDGNLTLTDSYSVKYISSVASSSSSYYLTLFVYGIVKKEY